MTVVERSPRRRNAARRSYTDDQAGRARLPERVCGGLVEAAYGLRLTHAAYKSIVEITAGEEISSLTASRDLRAMVEAHLLRPVGQTRGRYYVAEEVLNAERTKVQAIRTPKETSDPFDIALSREG